MLNSETPTNGITGCRDEFLAQEEAIGGGRKPYYDELRIITVMISRIRMEVKNAYKRLVGNLKGRDHTDEVRAGNSTRVNSISKKQVSRQ